MTQTDFLRGRNFANNSIGFFERIAISQITQFSFESIIQLLSYHSLINIRLFLSFRRIRWWYQFHIRCKYTSSCVMCGFFERRDVCVWRCRAKASGSYKNRLKSNMSLEFAMSSFDRNSSLNDSYHAALTFWKIEEFSFVVEDKNQVFY